MTINKSQIIDGKKWLDPQALDLEALNKRYKPLDPEGRLKALFQDFEKVLVTSSFGTSAIYLLHLLSRVNREVPVYFIDTGFHFHETLRYRDYIIESLGVNIQSVSPDPEHNALTRSYATWMDNPDLCCDFNKVRPVDHLKKDHDVWISGLMGWQSPERAKLNIFEQDKGIIKFHPLVDLKQEAFEVTLQQFHLPIHPLKAMGYDSIGCVHCTSKGKGREGRWKGSGKKECGLHFDLGVDREKGNEDPAVAS